MLAQEVRELSKWIKNWIKEPVTENEVKGRSEREEQQGGEAGHWGTMSKMRRQNPFEPKSPQNLGYNQGFRNLSASEQQVHSH